MNRTAGTGSERLGAATGIIAVILLAIGFLVTPKPPDVDAVPPDVFRYFVSEQDGIQTALVLFIVALFFFIWFLGSLRSALREVEGGTGRVSSIAFAGGIVSAAAVFLLIDLLAAAAFRPVAIGADVTTALNYAAIVSGAPALAGLTALFAATALVMLRSATFPSWLAGVNALAALAQPLAVGAMLTNDGAFAGDGVLGLVLPVLSFGLAILLTSMVLAQRAGVSGRA